MTKMGTLPVRFYSTMYSLMFPPVTPLIIGRNSLVFCVSEKEYLPFFLHLYRCPNLNQSFLVTVLMLPENFNSIPEVS